ncbi:MAG: SurA N-terminal domain-containing protein, partial [Chthoniobacterales bacterium]|nr:SurA N-terminal domain-containing protein [Chthoniobacterales bacterium]
MINVLRKNQKALWIVIALLCIPFVFYFSNSDIGGAIRQREFGRIYGRQISLIEFQRNARLFNLARDLGMYTLLQDMVAGANSQDEAYSDFTWNRLILRHEAERLGIKPAEEDIAKVVKGLRPFQGQAGFDIAKYNEFSQTVLPAMGFTEAQIEELAGDQLALARLKELVGTGVQIPEAESKENYERAYGKLGVTVVRLRTEDLAKDINITDEDIAKYYETHKAELNTEEKRKVSFVTFGLSEEQKKLAGKERVEVLQKLADRANDFSQALLDPGADFGQVATKFELPIQPTGEFTKTTPDPLLNANPQLTTGAFQLTSQEPNSDPLQVTDSFYVLHLEGVEPA